MSLTRAQYELLRAVEAGHVADRYHHRLGWATRRTDLLSGGPGGGLGLNVTAAARKMRDAGFAEPTNVEGLDRPWRLTVTGRLELAAQAAKRRDDR